MPILFAVFALLGVLGCAPKGDAQRPGPQATACRQWRLSVSNHSASAVHVYASGEGPETFLGTVGPSGTRSWTLSAEPERIVVRDQVRGAAHGVAIDGGCIHD